MIRIWATLQLGDLKNLSRAGYGTHDRDLNRPAVVMPTTAASLVGNWLTDDRLRMPLDSAQHSFSISNFGLRIANQSTLRS